MNEIKEGEGNAKFKAPVKGSSSYKAHLFVFCFLVPCILFSAGASIIFCILFSSPESTAYLILGVPTGFWLGSLYYKKQVELVESLTGEEYENFFRPSETDDDNSLSWSSRSCGIMGLDSSNHDEITNHWDPYNPANSEYWTEGPGSNSHHETTTHHWDPNNPMNSEYWTIGAGSGLHNSWDSHGTGNHWD